MLVEKDVSLQPCNTFGIQAKAHVLVRVTSVQDVLDCVAQHPHWMQAQPLVLGGGSNVVLTRDLDAVVLKIEVGGMRVVERRDDAVIVEAGAGVGWHELVAWTLDQGEPGLENLALIPGTVGAAPVQNIGAYGLELADRFESLDGMDLVTGRPVTLDHAMCAFGYRDSVFKQALAGKSVIVRVRGAKSAEWANTSMVKSLGRSPRTASPLERCSCSPELRKSTVVAKVAS